jgi:glycosyltransferase involved in cell wall biosynthesis
LLGWWWARTWRHPDSSLIVVDTDDLEGLGGWGGRLGLRSLGAVRSFQETFTLREIGRVTVTSRWLQSYVQRLGVPADRILYLPNGWARSLDSTEPAFDLPGDQPGLLWYTRFTEAQPERVAELLAPLLATETRTRLTVLGDEIHRGDLRRAQAAFFAAGVAGQVEWLGYETGRLEELARSRPLVGVYPLDDNLSNWARGVAKVSELMSLGLPVVAEAVGETSEYLASCAERSLAGPAEPDRFRSLVTDLLESPPVRAQVSTQERAAADAFRWDRTAGDLLSWYERQRASA